MKKGIKKNIKKRILSFMGLVCIVVAVLAGVVMFLLRYDELWRWYDLTQQKLSELETIIQNIPQKGLFVLAIILLFAVKCFIPIYPTSTVCFLTGIVLPIYQAVPVNIAGFLVMITIKYFWGFRFGGGMAWKLISKWEPLKQLILKDGRGNPWLLAGFRVVPGISINTISSIYGSMNFGFGRFLLLSAIGFMPRLVSFTVVGRNVFDPLSIGFLLPVMVVALISGFFLLSADGVQVIVKKIISSSANGKSDNKNEINCENKSENYNEN